MGLVIGIITAAALLVVLFLVNFYRDPKRAIPKGNNIVAPADGKVISIIKTGEKNIKINKGLLGRIHVLAKGIADECYVISIFMSPLDVHINRSPIEGTVKSIKHAKGRFFKAYDLEKSLENEKNEIIIQNKAVKIKVVQIAGFLARRIKCFVRINQKINKGDKIGMITLGSQATLILPKGVELKVKIGDRVKAGQSVIADMK